MKNFLSTISIITELIAWRYLISSFVGSFSLTKKEIQKIQIIAIAMILSLSVFNLSDWQFIPELLFVMVLLIQVKPKGFKQKLKNVSLLILWLSLPGFLGIYFCSINRIGVNSTQQSNILNILNFFMNIGIIFLVKKEKIAYQKIRLSKIDVFFTCLVNLIVFLTIFSIASEDGIAFFLSGDGRFWILNLLGIALGMLVIFLYLTIWNNATAKYYQEINNEKETFILNQMTYFKMYKDAQKDIRSFRHDFNQHLGRLNQLVKEEQANSFVTYLKELDNSWQDVGESLYQTGDESLDAILNLKIPLFRDKKIKLIERGSLTKDLILSPYDSTIIFANAFDNAIEAVGRLDEEERTIVLSIQNSDNFNMITVSNPLGNKREKKSRKDELFHGFGLMNIKATVEKYKGTLEINDTNKTFKLTIILPKIPLGDKN